MLVAQDGCLTVFGIVFDPVLHESWRSSSARTFRPFDEGRIIGCCVKPLKKLG
jgi:hypothetical protein